MKFGLHKIWFWYSDEWHCTTDDLAPTIDTFDSLEEAKTIKLEMDIQSLKNLGTDDFIRDLAGFMEKDNYQIRVKNLVDYAKSQYWNDELRERKYGNSEETYFELSLPNHATDEQLAEILNITGAYFHKIIEYTNVKMFAYMKFNHEFWGTKIFKAMKEDGTLEDRGPYINGEKLKGKYFVQKPTKGRKSATLRNIDGALENILIASLKHLNELGEYSFLGKTYFSELSDSPTLLRSFLENCETLSIKKEIVDASNIKKITSKLKKLKSSIILNEGDEFESIVLPKNENINTTELKGFFNLLKVKPFEIFEQVDEIEGESIKTYMPDSYTL